MSVDGLIFFQKTIVLARSELARFVVDQENVIENVDAWA
jgi:hypothetical protein